MGERVGGHEGGLCKGEMVGGQEGGKWIVGWPVGYWVIT